MELTVAITGASGAIYAHKTLTHLAASGVVNRSTDVSDSARTVAMVELALICAPPMKKISDGLLPSRRLRLHRLDNMAATLSPAPAARMITALFDGNAGRDCSEPGRI